MILVIQLIFLLLALLWVLSCFLPNWSGPVTITIASVIRCLVGLVVLAVVYLIVVALFGVVPVAVR